MKINLKYNPAKTLSNPLYILSGIVFTAVLGFSLFYLFSGFGYLQIWYKSINPCFYNANGWSSFFNPGTKASGDLFCATAIIASIIGLIYVFWKLRISKKSGPAIHIIQIETQDILFAIALGILLTLLWLWGQTLVAPSFDEVFSAVNCAGIPVFQCLSYYMLPNNHVFFNVLNNILFHGALNHVFTGRLISLTAYLVLTIWAYFWFLGQFKNRIYAFLAAVVLAVQFPIWGFGFQARGYEIYTLAQWGAFVLLFDYINTGSKKYLGLNSFFCVLGYITIPSFLYYHIGQIVFVALYQTWQKKFDARFWKYQALAILFVFYFYLPALCFSGSGAIIHNRYVSPSPAPVSEFFNEAKHLFRSYIEYCFSNSSLAPSALSLGLFLAPLLLLFFKKKWFGIFFIVQVISFMGMVFIMKKCPFHRNLIGLDSIVLTLFIIAVYQVFDKINWRYFKSVFPLLMIALAAYFIRLGSPGMSNNLYYDDARPYRDAISQYLDSLPKGTVVGCSDQSFYWYYLCMQKHIMAHQCPDGLETYFVKDKDEPFPAYLKPFVYILQSKVKDSEIYRLKD